MNLLEHIVKEVLEIKKVEDETYDFYLVKVMADCYGNVKESTIICHTYEEAKQINPGHVFMA